MLNFTSNDAIGSKNDMLAQIRNETLMNAWAATSLTVLFTFLGEAIATITAVYLKQRKETKRLSAVIFLISG